MKLTFTRAAAAGVLCLGLAAASAFAQPAGPGGPGGPPGPRAGEHQKMFEAMKQRREQRLHDLLQIRPDQEAAFRAFVAAVEPQPRGGDRGPPGPRQPEARPQTTPERLDRMAQRMAERQQRFQKLAAATKTFYAALNPDQRKAFDALHAGGGRGGHGRFGRRMGMRGGPGFDGPPPPRAGR